MEIFYAVHGKIPGGENYRGLAVTRGSSPVVMRAPQAFSRKPWDKRALTLDELRKYGEVERVHRPRLTASVQRQLEHKFVQATDLMETLHRGKLLQLAQDVLSRLE